MIKRFLVEKSTKGVSMLPEGEENQLELVTSDWKPIIQINFRKMPGEDEATVEEINVEEFIAVKGLKAKGNQLTKDTVNTIDLLDPIPYEPPTPEGQEPPTDDGDDGDEEKEDEEAADSEESTTVELEIENPSAQEPLKKEEPNPENPKKEDSPKGPATNGSSEGQLGLF